MLQKKNSLLNLNTVIYFLLIIVSVWIIYLIVYGHGGIVERKKIINEITLLHREIEKLKDEKAKLIWEIKNLTTNERYIAGLAHENGYRKEDEIIFKFLKKKSLINSKLKNYPLFNK